MTTFEGLVPTGYLASLSDDDCIPLWRDGIARHIRAFVASLASRPHVLNEPCQELMNEFITKKSLEAAVTLAEEQNYASASERLKITQADLAEQIVYLEQRLGFTLFRVAEEFGLTSLTQRLGTTSSSLKNKQVKVTQKGKAFIATARSFLHQSRGTEVVVNRED